MCLWAEVGLVLSGCLVDPATLPAFPGPSEASVLDQKSVCKFGWSNGAELESQWYSQRWRSTDVECGVEWAVNARPASLSSPVSVAPGAFTAFHSSPSTFAGNRSSFGRLN